MIEELSLTELKFEYSSIWKVFEYTGIWTRIRPFEYPNLNIWIRMLEYSNLNRLINFEQATRLSQSELKYSSIQIRISFL